MPAVISRRRRAAVAVVAIAAVAGLAITPVASADNRGQSRLERLVLSSLRSAGFTEVIDGNATFPYPQIAHTPNIDVGVIRLDKKGRPREAVNALMSRDYPRGVLAPIGKDLRSVGVRFRAWNLNRFDGANGFTWTMPPFTAADDVVAGRERAPIQFMEPYPASSFKLVIGYWIADAIDRGRLAWNDTYAYDPGPNPPGL